ncbi:MAG: hypothetical protein NZV14_08330 [Bryobacteraceae bacterium]|nr:hypothetical protein [Bryobacteraceae bacterium]MDW8378154.1 hypothetical protein [Bryobacterales bacterium]
MFLFAFFISPLLAQVPVDFAPLPVTITPPTGWKLSSREDNNAALMPTAPLKSVLLVHTGIYDDAEQLGLATGFAVKELNLRDLRLTGKPEERVLQGRQTFALTFVGTNNEGQELSIYASCSLLNSVGLSVIAISPHSAYDTVKAAADQLVLTAKLGTFSFDPKHGRPLVGRWRKSHAVVSGNQSSASGGWADSSRATVTFFPEGTYQYSAESVVSVSAGSASLFSSSEEKDGGRYFVFQDKILFTSQKNGSRIFKLHLRNEQMQLGDTIWLRDE